MKKKILLLAGFICFPTMIFAQASFVPLYGLSAAGVAENMFSGNTIMEEPIQNNKYLMESVRANNLAKIAFEEGDYDLSKQFSEDALRAARRSDELITQKLKIAEANKKIGEANDRLSWADSKNGARLFAKEYNAAKEYYNHALRAREDGNWNDALNNAIRSVQALVSLNIPQAAARPQTGATVFQSAPLPSQYTVRRWESFGDCFWNIAGRPWAYADPYRWPLLYRANRSKLPDPNNPNIIDPGTVLDIPSLYGETREGMWDPAKRYVPLR
ncbi:MAG: LysM peptidoglycan-binding domain-containing protein [Spirochaetaceae bacterium]|jgi:HEPN domain-containing protein|nr:LysM peptidoglycan-binding domain-containing protein [Spirochaetaceae bacterium]